MQRRLSFGAEVRECLNVHQNLYDHTGMRAIEGLQTFLQ